MGGKNKQQKTNSKPLSYGVYGEKESLLPDFMYCENFELRNKKNTATINDHIHTTLFQLYIIESGVLDLKIETTGYKITGPAIITIPQNTRHGVPADKNLKGMVLSISTLLVETHFKNHPQALLDLNTPQIITKFDKENSFETILNYTNILDRELKSLSDETKLTQQSYFNLLLSLINRMVNKKPDRLIIPNNRNSRYFASFQKSIKDSYSVAKSIQEYAVQLNITSVHLNRICKTITGKSASQIINDFLILEAEKFLKQTDDNISEIAYRLNFEDPAYFSRFFHKQVGLSPKQFREENG